jgi:hypothetical protein
MRSEIKLWNIVPETPVNGSIAVYGWPGESRTRRKKPGQQSATSVALRVLVNLRPAQRVLQLQKISKKNIYI